MCLDFIHEQFFFAANDSVVLCAYRPVNKTKTINKFVLLQFYFTFIAFVQTA